MRIDDLSIIVYDPPQFLHVRSVSVAFLLHLGPDRYPAFLSLVGRDYLGCMESLFFPFNGCNALTSTCTLSNPG